MNSAAMVQEVAHVATQPSDGGSRPTSSLQSIRVRPIPIKVAKELLVREHYLHSLPGGTQMTFGAFLGNNLLGAITLGAGPFNAHRIVDYASPDNCLILTRLWLSDQLPKTASPG